MVCGAMQGTILNDYDFVHSEETVRASQIAYQQLGIKDPRNEIDLAEVHDCFTITELLLYEGLGFSPRGKGPEDVIKGTFELMENCRSIRMEGSIPSAILSGPVGCG